MVPSHEYSIQSRPVETPQSGRSGTACIWLLVLPLAGALLGVFGGATVAYLSPKKFESATVVQLNGTGDGSPDLETEMAVMTSAVNLEWVSERLDLPSRWMQDRDAVVRSLQGAARPAVIEGTDLIEIRVRHTNAADARDVADAIVEAYVMREAGQARKQAEEELKVMEAELRELEERTEEKRKIFDLILETRGAPDFSEEASEAPRPEDDEKQKEVAKLLATAKEDIVRTERDLGLVKGMDMAALTEHVLARDDLRGEVATARSEYLVARRALELLEDAGSVDQVLFVRLKARLDVAAVGLAKAIENWRNPMEERLEELKARVLELEVEQEELAASMPDRAAAARAFYGAKSEYEGVLKRYKDLRGDMAKRRTALRMPLKPVTIHEKARVAMEPVAPRVSVHVMTGFAAGAGTGLAVGLLIMLGGALWRS